MKYCIIIFTATLWSFLFPLFAEGQVASDAEPQTLVDSLLQKLEQKIERQKAYDDSVKYYQKLLELRKKNPEAWHTLNTDMLNVLGEDDLMSPLCDIYIRSYSPDTISYVLRDFDKHILNHDLHLIHYAEVTGNLKLSMKFQNYLKVWGDSLANHPYEGTETIIHANDSILNEFGHQIASLSPNGYVWFYPNFSDYNSKHICASVLFVYFGTGEPVKYVDFYFQGYNEAGEICPTDGGRTEMVQERLDTPEETGEWRFFHDHYLFPKDLYNIELKEVLVTYQNGKVVDMVGDNIILD